jgi:hypothetical protein
MEQSKKINRDLDKWELQAVKAVNVSLLMFFVISITLTIYVIFFFWLTSGRDAIDFSQYFIIFDIFSLIWILINRYKLKKYKEQIIYKL